MKRLPTLAGLLFGTLLGFSALVQAAPTVSLSAPANAAQYLTPATLTVSASATPSSGTTITKVEFYQGSTLIGTDTTSPYSISWANPAAGAYSLTAKATDSASGVTTSAVRTVTVNATNTAPTVSLSAPANNAAVQAPVDVTISASVSAPEVNDTITKVEFYQGSTLIGTATASPWQVTWVKPAAGVYNLTAKATDGQGAITTSAARKLTVSATAVAKLYYLHTDHLDTPRLVTDETNKVVWRNTPLAEPFGNATPEEDPDADGTKFSMGLRFPGQYYDKETNTNYNYYRDYDPSTGRYLESDPIGLDGGINTYSYTGGKPLSYIDPMGLSGCKWIGTLLVCEYGPPPAIGGTGNPDIDGALGGGHGGPLSTPSPVEAASGNQVDTAIQQAYNNYASNARMNCPSNDPDNRCEWLKKNAQYFPSAAVKATAKAWGCRGSRWSGGNSF